MTNPPTNFLQSMQPTTPGGTPLTQEQLASIERAAVAYRELRRCAGWAMMSGVSTLLLGVLSFCCLGFGLVTGIIAIAVLLTVGTVELMARYRLLNADPKAPKLLAMNQLAFIIAITLYCGVQMATMSVKESVKEMNNSPLLAGQLDINQTLTPEMQRQFQLLVYAFYAIVAILAWISQGRLAVYYLRRKPSVDVFNATPEWQRNLVRNVSK